MKLLPVIDQPGFCIERCARLMDGIPNDDKLLRLFSKMPQRSRDLCKRLLQITVMLGAFSAGTQNLVSAEAATPSAQLSSVSTNQASIDKSSLDTAAESIWQKGVGEGFRPGTQSLTVSAGATYGIAAFGTVEAHHLGMGSLTYGHMLGQVTGEGHWWRGNPEFRLEVFSGAQFEPDTRWFVGLTPHFRYNFATGTRWIPLFDIGAGVTATSIGPPDLSGTFEFNLQATTGVQYFLKDNIALSLEARFVHWSCAGIHRPNLGLNGVTSLLGISFYF